MDKLRGVVSDNETLNGHVRFGSGIAACFLSLQDSLPVVLHRFSNGVEVVKCVVDFCNVSCRP